MKRKIDYSTTVSKWISLFRIKLKLSVNQIISPRDLSFLIITVDKKISFGILFSVFLTVTEWILFYVFFFMFVLFWFVSNFHSIVLQIELDH